MAGTELLVCIVNWRTAAMTVDCLKSVSLERDGTRLRAIVVDNFSGDGSAEAIRAAITQNGWAGWVDLIAADRNGGFAYGNNLAIRTALRDHPEVEFLLLLNPDTVVRKGALRHLLDFAKAHDDVGIVGGSCEDPDGTRQHCAFRFPTATSEFAGYLRVGVVDRLLSRWIVTAGIPAAPTQVDWVSGAALLFRRAVIEQTGLLDEGYFLYYEETDFILRARRVGWTCWHVPESRIVHLVGQSSGVQMRDATPKRLPAYWFESRRRYFTLNHGRLYAVLADLAAMSGYALWKLRTFIGGKPGSDPPHFLADICKWGAIANGRDSLQPRKTGVASDS